MVDASCILFLQSLDVQNCINAMLLKDTDITIVKWIWPDKDLLSICLLNEKWIQEVSITLISNWVDDEDSISIHLMTASILSQLTMIMAWVNYLKSPHRLSFFLKTSHARAPYKVVLNLIWVVLPLTTIISFCIVKDKLGLPWNHLLSVFVVKPSILSWHLVHLDRGWDSIFRVLFWNDFKEGLVAVIVGGQVNWKFNEKLFPNIVEIYILDLLVRLTEAIEFTLELVVGIWIACIGEGRCSTVETVWSLVVKNFKVSNSINTSFPMN